MVLPTPPSPNVPIPNNPFYSPQEWELSGPTGPFVIGSGLVISSTGVISATGGGGSPVTSIIAGPGISVSSAIGNVAITNTGVLGIVAGLGISISGTSGLVTITATEEGTVTSVGTGYGLNITGSANPITEAGTIELADSGVVPGVYTYPQLQIDAKGRILAVNSQTAIQSITGAGAISVTPGDFVTVSVADASTATKGAVQLSDSVTSASSLTAATSLAVKTAYDAVACSIPKSCLTGQGALVTATALGVPSTLSVGAPGQTLIADPSCVNGLKWADNDTGTVCEVNTGTGLIGGPITTTGTVCLADTAVTPGVYCSANITVDAQGRITSAANGAVCLGTVCEVNTGTGLTGGPINTVGTICLTNTAVTPASYTYTNLTVDQQGRITAASSAAIPFCATDNLNNCFTSLGCGITATPATSDGSVIIGTDAYATPLGVAVGAPATSSGFASVAIGSQSCAAANLSIAIGRSTNATVNCAIAIGAGQTADSTTPLVIGNWITGDPFNRLNFCAGNILDYTGAAPTPLQVLGTNASNEIVWTTINAATTTVPGIVQLNNTTTSTSITEALTAAQGKSLQDQIDALAISSNLTFAGTLNASTGNLVTVSSAGAAAGFAIGSPLPAASAGNTDYFVIVEVASASYTPPGGSPTEAHVGDWFLSNGVSWQFLNVGLQPPYASTTDPGIVQLATDAEVQGGTNTNYAVVPSSLQSKISDSTSTTSSTTIASSTAVKTAYGVAIAAVPCASFTAIGNLLAGTGAGTYSALGIGANNQVLTVDSTCATGLKWAVPTSGTVTDVNTGTGLIGGPITSSGTISLADTGVTSGTYDNATITVDAQGRLTAASTGVAPVLSVTGLSPVVVDNSDPTSPIVTVDAATLTTSGVVQLATDAEVQGGTNTNYAVVPSALQSKISDETGLTSSTTIASSTAVKTAYDVAIAAVPCASFTAIGSLLAGTGAGTYSDLNIGTNNQVLTVDSTCATGLKWAASSVGSVTQVDTGTGLIGGPITASGTIALADTLVTPGTYNNATITVDAQGRLTAASTGTTAVLSVTGLSPIVVDNINPTSPVVTVDAATLTTPGAVQLNNTTASTSTTEALTAAQGKSLQDQINALSITSNLTLVGTLDSVTGNLLTVSAAGTAAGFAIGSPLVAASAGNTNYFVIVQVASTSYTPPGGSAVETHIGDWFLSNGVDWQFLNVGFQAPYTSTTDPGIVQLATDAEVQGGTNTNYAVVPSSLQSKISDETGLTSSTTIASSTAVKTAYGVAIAAVPCASFTAIGNLLAGTGAGTYSALGIGANNQVLTVDSTCATGLKWAPAAAGSVTQINTGAGLAGGPITSSGTISIANTGVITGSYSYASFTVNSRGQLMNATSGPAPVCCSAYTAKGSILAASATSTPVNVAIGTNNQMLVACSTCTAGVAWVTPQFAQTDLYTGKGAIVVGCALRVPSTLTVGTTGQVLTANSTCALGMSWATPADVPCSLLEGKGSLITATAAATPVSLPVGLNGQVLTVNPGCVEGVQWKDIVLPTNPFGNFYNNNSVSCAGGGTTTNCFPIIFTCHRGFNCVRLIDGQPNILFDGGGQFNINFVGGVNGSPNGRLIVQMFCNNQLITTNAIGFNSYVGWGQLQIVCQLNMLPNDQIYFLSATSDFSNCYTSYQGVSPVGVSLSAFKVN